MLQTFLVYLSHTRGEADPLPARPDAGKWAHARVAAERAHSKNCHSAAPASNTKATSSHCVQPNPFIPFSPACIATKAQKLGSCVDDRVTNLFGETHCTGRLYSSAAERGELNMDMQRWVSLCKYEPTMPCYYPWNNSYIPYGTDAPARRLSAFDTTRAIDTRSQVHLLLLEKLCLV